MLFDDVTSVTMADDKDATYTHSQRDSMPSGKIWKRKVVVKKQPVVYRYDKDYWSRRSNYFLFVILLGNGVDGLPLVFRFALDLSGGLFVLLLFIFTFTLTMPIMYMESFLGKYTKLTNGQMYRMAPIFFGFSVLLFVINMLYAPIRATDISLFLIGALKIIIIPDYMDQCPANTETCSNRKPHQFKNATCKYDYMSFILDGRGTIRYVTEYLYWSTFRNLQGYYPYWQCIIATGFTWIFIILLCVLGMKVLGIILRGTFAINFVILTVIFIMAICADGGVSGLENLFQIRLQEAKFNKIVMAGFFITLKMGVISPTGYMTYSAYTSYKSNMGPESECLVLSMGNVVLTIYYLVIVHSIGGVLSHNLQIPLKCTIVPFAGMYYAMIPEFLKYRECPNIFIVLFHLSNWSLEITRVALSLHMQILNLHDFFPKIASYQSYVKIIVGLTSALLSVIASVKIITVVIIPLHTALATLFLQGFLLFIMSVMVFYCYGVSRLNDDIHFLTGRRPIKYWRILWYIYPLLITLGLLLIVLGEFERQKLMGFGNDLPKHTLMRQLLIVGLAICILYLCIILFCTFFYIVMGIRSSTTIMNLLKPQFHWGPPDKDARIARKLFAPRTSIRSQPCKKRKQRFRPRSIKQMHERDIAEHVKRGRIFLDAMFFTNIGEFGSKYTTDYKLHSKLN